MILTTRDRPDFFPVALACCRHQTYANRELIVVDDGDRYPVDAALVAAEGGRLIRADPGTSIGTKLNTGIEAAAGYLCLVIDDDDWYAPGYVGMMVGRLLADWRGASHASMVGAAPYLIFDLARWVILQTIPSHVGGGSLGFRREDWVASPFRPINRSVDRQFLADQARLGTRMLTVAAPEDFLGVRHRGVGNNRGHTWIDERGYIDRLTSCGRSPDDLLTSWAVAFYRHLSNEQRSEIGATSPIARLLARVRRTEP
jgi:glycosyltransferase involved in cell wall biosynthesis